MVARRGLWSGIQRLGVAVLRRDLRRIYIYIYIYIYIRFRQVLRRDLRRIYIYIYIYSVSDTNTARTSAEISAVYIYSPVKKTPLDSTF